MTDQSVQPQKIHEQQAAPTGGVPVRTDLHAGACWGQINEQATKLLNQVVTSVSNIVSNLNNCPTKPSA